MASLHEILDIFELLVVYLPFSLKITIIEIIVHFLDKLPIISHSRHILNPVHFRFPFIKIDLLLLLEPLQPQEAYFELLDVFFDLLDPLFGNPDPPLILELLLNLEPVGLELENLLLIEILELLAFLEKILQISINLGVFLPDLLNQPRNWPQSFFCLFVGILRNEVEELLLSLH